MRHRAVAESMRIESFTASPWHSIQASKGPEALAQVTSKANYNWPQIRDDCLSYSSKAC